MSIADAFNTLYKDDPMQWAESANELASKTCPSEYHEEFDQTIKTLTKLTEMFNHMILNMDMHNLYITEHIYTAMPKQSYKNLIDFAENVVTEPVGEDNYMSNYPQYNELRAESEKFARNFQALPWTTQFFFKDAIGVTSTVLFTSLHTSADHYETEVTKDISFDADF